MPYNNPVSERQCLTLLIRRLECNKYHCGSWLKNLRMYTNECILQGIVKNQKQQSN